MKLDVIRDEKVLFSWGHSIFFRCNFFVATCYLNFFFYGIISTMYLCVYISLHQMVLEKLRILRDWVNSSEKEGCWVELLTWENGGNLWDNNCSEKTTLLRVWISRWDFSQFAMPHQEESTFSQGLDPCGCTPKKECPP